MERLTSRPRFSFVPLFLNDYLCGNHSCQQKLLVSIHRGKDGELKKGRSERGRCCFRNSLVSARQKLEFKRLAKLERIGARSLHPEESYPHCTNQPIEGGPRFSLGYHCCEYDRVDPYGVRGKMIGEYSSNRKDKT